MSEIGIIGCGRYSYNHNGRRQNKLYFGRDNSIYVSVVKIVHYDTSATKRFLTSVSLQHEPQASDVITLVKKTFVRTSIVRNFISRGVKMRISARAHIFLRLPIIFTNVDVNLKLGKYFRDRD